MNPQIPGCDSDERSAYKDAIYFSGHKFVGGVQTPGVLIAKKAIFRRVNTCEPDGFFASTENEKCFDTQEEGSCAAVVESIRAGLVMQLKETVSVPIILQRMEKINKQMLQHIRTIPEIILLGNNSPNVKRIPVYSFMVRHPRGIFLHHNFVCAVLNDVFGIQARAGCPCSGVYAQDLLGIDQSLADQYEHIILEDRRLSSLNLGVENSTLQLLRPGFTRISLPYFINDAELAFIMEAVKMVATEGWKLLPQYVVDLDTAEWRHHTNAVSKDRKWLSSIRYIDGKMTMNERRISGPGLFPQNYSECLQTARNLFNKARKTVNRAPYPDQGIAFDSRGEKLRWFMLQHEAQSLLTSNAQNVKQTVPFDPIGYSSRRSEKDCEKEEKREDLAQPLPNPGGSPRHYSLPSIDDPRIIQCSSPVPYFLQDVNGLYYPQMSQGTVNFAVGESVNSSMSQQLQQNFARERCLSLGAPNVSPPLLSPSTRVSLGYDCSQCGRSSPAHDLQTYVTEMTKELATNIKSEIREVISRVEDVLENTDNGGSFYERHGSGSEDGRSDSISANDVAEYLEKVSIEMANEVKSEIRDVLSAVDVFITPDSQEKRSYSRASSAGDDRSIPDKYTPGSSGETVIQINKSMSSNKLADEEQAANEKVSKNKIMTSTVASVSSQDSGINLSFHEQDVANQQHEVKVRSNSESLHGHRKSDSEIRFSTLQKQKLKIFRDLSDGDERPLWNCPQKTVWQPSVDAITEFDMIRDGDKVMVCLSGGKDSLCLLHTLLHYQTHVKSKGVLFSIGAITVDPDSSGCDPCVLIPHLKTLGVHYIIDDKKPDLGLEPEKQVEAKENYYSFGTAVLRHRLYAAAKSSGYNVLAIGQHLDDVCESFLLSVFHTGRLRALRAQYYIREHDLRIIRPLVHVREKALRQFSSNENLPVFTSPVTPRISKERQRVKQLLAQQEILFPKLFCSLRVALHPFIGYEIKECEIRSRKRRQAAEEAEGADFDIDDEETDEETVVQAKSE
nr:unnamed protein product [Callosobruchus chinensis]